MALLGYFFYAKNFFILLITATSMGFLFEFLGTNTEAKINALVALDASISQSNKQTHYDVVPKKTL